MPREIFSDVVDSSVKLGTKRWYTIPLSIVTHTIALAALIVVPLLATDMLPTPQSIVTFMVAPPAPSTLPPPPSTELPAPPIEADINPAFAPVVAPDTIAAEPPPRITAAPAGRSPATLGVSARLTTAPPPAPPQAPIPVGGLVQAPRKLHHVDPIYPSIAKAARASGIVIIEAIIAKDGSVRDARVTRSSPLLDNAALAAVLQWKYTTPTLNGTPVDVIMTVVVNFTLK